MRLGNWAVVIGAGAASLAGVPASLGPEARHWEKPATSIRHPASANRRPAPAVGPDPFGPPGPAEPGPNRSWDLLRTPHRRGAERSSLLIRELGRRPPNSSAGSLPRPRQPRLGWHHTGYGAWRNFRGINDLTAIPVRTMIWQPEGAWPRIRRTQLGGTPCPVRPPNSGIASKSGRPSNNLVGHNRQDNGHTR